MLEQGGNPRVSVEIGNSLHCHIRLSHSSHPLVLPSPPPRHYSGDSQFGSSSKHKPKKIPLLPQDTTHSSEKSDSISNKTTIQQRPTNKTRRHRCPLCTTAAIKIIQRCQLAARFMQQHCICMIVVTIISTSSINTFMRVFVF
jgi:hypothetical protein